MNALVLLTAVLILAAILIAFVGLFVFSCRLAGLPRPRFITATGVVVASSLILFVVEAVLIALLRQVYAWAGFPPWEVWLVGIFVGLPVSLAASAVLHIALMRVTLSKAVQVWLFERAIRYSFLFAGVGAYVALTLAKK